jgi:hypothetical protein
MKPTIREISRDSALKEEYLMVKEEYLVKSNQVCARMEIEISDCYLTIAKMFYIVIRT